VTSLMPARGFFKKYRGKVKGICTLTVRRSCQGAEGKEAPNV